MDVNQIYLGDAYELIKQVPDKSVDLIVTDPPYEFGTGGIRTGLFKNRESAGSYQEIHDNGIGEGISLRILDEFVRVMKRINCYIWCNKEQIYDYMTYFVKERGCNFEILIWAKDNPPPFTNAHYLKDKEYCLFFWEKGVKLNTSYDSARTVYLSSLNVADKKLYGHPTIKPEAIIENLIKNSATAFIEDGERERERAVVFDPFVGSGTTCAVAKRLGYGYLGFEINEAYHRIACDRLNGITKKEADSGFVQEKLF